MASIGHHWDSLPEELAAESEDLFACLVFAEDMYSSWLSEYTFSDACGELLATGFTSERWTLLKVMEDRDPR